MNEGVLFRKMLMNNNISCINDNKLKILNVFNRLHKNSIDHY